ncbi:MAG: PTS transporter subunit IIC [Angelakisella sp.]|nr:PTS transporter subunit IIC [Angelakisella sp.]
MKIVVDFFDILYKFGATVLIPVIIILIALVLRLKPDKAVKAGISVGVSLIGLTLIANLLGSNLSGIGQLIIERNEYTSAITDVGWQVSVAISNLSRIGVYIIPMCVLLNIIMLLTKTTRTINLDIWNFWQASFVGAMVDNLTGNMTFGIIAAVVTMAVILVIADNTAVHTEKYLGLEGISLPHGFAVAFAPIAFVVNKLLDLIPGYKNIVISLKNLRKIAGYAASPAPIALVIGILLGIISGKSVYSTAQLAVIMAAVVVLLPKVIEVLKEGLAPVTHRIQAFAEKKLHMQGKLYLGMSGTLALGNPTVLLVSMILAPFSIYLANILPGNGLMPGPDIVMLPYVVIFCVAIARGDLIRSLVGGVVSLIAMFYAGTAMAELFTKTVLVSNVGDYAQAGIVSNLCASASPITWAVVNANLYGIAGAALLIVAAVALLVWNHNQITGGVKLYVRQTKTIRASHIEAVETEPEVLPPVPDMNLERIEDHKKPMQALPPEEHGDTLEKGK